VHAAFLDSPELLQWVTGVPDDATLAAFEHWAAQLQLPIAEVPPPAAADGEGPRRPGGCPGLRAASPRCVLPRRAGPG
jgi:hypothetical protein